MNSQTLWGVLVAHFKPFAIDSRLFLLSEMAGGVGSEVAGV